MIKRIATFLFFSLCLLCITAAAVYYLNPFEVKSDNLRPRLFGMDIYRIPSRSMQPLLLPSDVILVSNIAYKNKQPQRGDVIVFYHPKPKKSQENLPYIKRVVAIGGDTVLLQNGQLFVNKKPVEEAYVKPSNKKTPYSLKMRKQTVPENHVFLMGDNRDNSADSRLFGVVSNKAIIAQATSILYGRQDRSGTEIK